jgi:hypothetical protein
MGGGAGHAVPAGAVVSSAGRRPVLSAARTASGAESRVGESGAVGVSYRGPGGGMHILGRQMSAEI